MLRIILCDDDSFFLSFEKEIITKIISDGKINAAVSCTASSAAEILSFTGSNPGAYLIFMDLDFGESLANGIDITSLLKQNGADIRVVFTTNHHEMAMNVLKSGIEPFGFLEKGTNIEILAAGLRRYIYMALRAVSNNKMQKGDDGTIITLATAPGETIEILKSEILYIETEKNISHGITYHTINDSKITVIGTLDAEAEKLGNTFLRVHRSYIAAKNQIIGIKDGYITLSNREEIPCSFKMRPEIRKLLNRK